MLMDLSPLERHRLFRCSTPLRSHEEVALTFCDHGLQWRQGRIDTSMSRLHFGRLDIISLQYGAEVEVRPRAFVDFVLLHLSLHGTLSLEGSAATVTQRAGDAVLLGEQPSLRMRWSEGTRQLIVKVPRHALPSDVVAPPQLVFDPIETGQLRGLLQALLFTSGLPAQAPMAGGPQPDWRDHLEQTILLFITSKLRRSAGHAPLQPLLAHTPQHERDQRRIERLLAYLRGRLGAPIGLEDMARAAGLSPRGLHLLCQRHTGQTPMEILRELRLDAVRTHLMNHPDTPVTQIALAYGFGHLGRFSGYYRQRFGELPTQTSRRDTLEGASDTGPARIDVIATDNG